MKNFTQHKLIECLVGQDWEDLGKTEDVNNKVKAALDVCAPWKNIKIRPNYKSGVSEKTRELIKQRDDLRKSIHKSSNEKKIIHEQYKKLCNRVANQIQRDTQNHNEEKIEKARDEKEIWKVVNQVIKPKEKCQWKFVEEEQEIEDEAQIGNIFNNFFVEKISSLKSGINQKYVKEPLAKL